MLIYLHSVKFRPYPWFVGRNSIKKLVKVVDFALAVCQFESQIFGAWRHDHRIWWAYAHWFVWAWPRFSWEDQDSDGHAHDFLGSPHILGGHWSEYIRAEFSHFGTAHCWEFSRLHDPRYFPEIKDQMTTFIIHWKYKSSLEKRKSVYIFF